MQDIIAAGGIAQHLGSGDDFVFVIVAEPGDPGSVAIKVKFDTDLFVNTDFRVEVRVAQQIAAAFGDSVWTTVAAGGEQIAFTGLIEVRRFKHPRDTGLQREHIAQRLRQIEAWAPVAAKLIMIIETNAGDQVGAGHGFDIIFQIDTGEGGAVFGTTLRRVAGDPRDSLPVAVSGLHRCRVVELIMVPFHAQRQRLIRQPEERHIEFGGSTPGFQSAGGIILTVDHAFDAAGGAFLQAGIVGFLVVNPRFGLAPIPKTVVGQSPGLAIEAIRFVSVQGIHQPVRAKIAVAVLGITGIYIPLTAIGVAEIENLLRGHFP